MTCRHSPVGRTACFGIRRGSNTHENAFGARGRTNPIHTLRPRVVKPSHDLHVSRKLTKCSSRRRALCECAITNYCFSEHRT